MIQAGNLGLINILSQKSILFCESAQRLVKTNHYCIFWPFQACVKNKML